MTPTVARRDAPADGRYVALLRGINVGGRNMVKMAALRECFEEQGFADVTTYIQSGNVLFTSPGSDRDSLVRRIEELLTATFKYRASVVLRGRKEMQTVIARAPDGFGSDPERYRYDVIFLKDPLSAAEAITSVPVAPGVDEAHAGPGVIYFSRVASTASSSQLPRLNTLPIYQRMTIRNWNTTTTLLRMMTDAG
jgi:uncharacterized protein (DUF1697 family)